MRKISLVSISLALSACASGYNPVYSYNQIQLANLSDTAVSNVRIDVENGRSLSCTNLAKNSICDAHFGKRRYPNQAIDLTWTDADGNQRSQRLTPTIAAYYNSSLALQLFLEIDAEGVVESRFEQEGPLAP